MNNTIIFKNYGNEKVKIMYNDNNTTTINLFAINNNNKKGRLFISYNTLDISNNNPTIVDNNNLLKNVSNYAFDKNINDYRNNEENSLTEENVQFIHIALQMKELIDMTNYDMDFKPKKGFFYNTKSVIEPIKKKFSEKIISLKTTEKSLKTTENNIKYNENNAENNTDYNTEHNKNIDQPIEFIENNENNENNEKFNIQLYDINGHIYNCIPNCCKATYNQASTKIKNKIKKI
jgi:hypothetical protein